MSVLFQLVDGAKYIGDRPLFSESTFAVNTGEHIGVIGPNGAGKTSLFKTIIGEYELDEGRIITSNQMRLGYLAQEPKVDQLHIIAREYISSTSLLPEWMLEKLGQGLGLTPLHLDGSLAELSGGYRMRCELLRLIGQEPNFILLDEPTNYLDLESLFVLEKFLVRFAGAFLLISHDREFLRRTCDQTLEVEGGSITKFNGNIDDYFEQKQMLQQQLEKQNMAKDQKRKEILQFAARFGAKANKAKQVQSRLKSLKKLEPVEYKSLITTTKISIPEPIRTGKLVMEAKQVDLGYENHTVLKQVDFNVFRGDHVGIVGINGAGKSTLLKGLSKQLQLQSGSITHGLNVEVGYYAQHVSEALNKEDTVYSALAEKAHPQVSRQEILDLAGGLLFSGESIHKKIKVLSGGEKARVALGQILLAKSPCLLLDEPTNHLDFHTVEALTLALQKFDGSLIVISHDRAFIQRVAKKILLVNEGLVSLFPGNYEEYLWSVEKGSFEFFANNLSSQKSTEQESNVDSRDQQPTESNNLGSSLNMGSSPPSKRERKELQKQVYQYKQKSKSLELVMASIEKDINQLNHQLLSSSGEQAASIAQQSALLNQKHQQAENEWLTIQEQIETLESQF